MPAPLSVRLGIVVTAVLFCTPISESSTPSKAGCDGSVLVVTEPSALIVNNTAQLESNPTPGHWLKGGVGAALAGLANTHIATLSNASPSHAE